MQNYRSYGYLGNIHRWIIADLKPIAKKHKGILKDLLALSEQLKQNPTLGTPLGQGIYKIRLSISGTSKGKSGGARVITCVVLVREVIFLPEIYLKSEYDTASPNQVIKRLEEEGLL